MRRQKAPTWQALGFVPHPPQERMEILMTCERWMSRWWKVSVVALAIPSLLMGVLAGSNGYTWWAIEIGFVPAALLLIGVAIRNRRRGVATALLVVPAWLRPCGSG